MLRIVPSVRIRIHVFLQFYVLYFYNLVCLLLASCHYLHFDVFNDSILSSSFCVQGVPCQPLKAPILSLTYSQNYFLSFVHFLVPIIVSDFCGNLGFGLQTLSINFIFSLLKFVLIQGVFYSQHSIVSSPPSNEIRSWIL